MKIFNNGLPSEQRSHWLCLQVFKLDKALRDWKAPAIPVLQGLPTPEAMSLALQSFALHGLKETSNYSTFFHYKF